MQTRYIKSIPKQDSNGELLHDVDDVLNLNKVNSINGVALPEVQDKITNLLSELNNLKDLVQSELGDSETKTISQKTITNYINSILYIGKIELHSVTKENFPDGFIPTDGELFLKDSPTGKAIMSLKETDYFTNWNISETKTSVSTPKIDDNTIFTCGVPGEISVIKDSEIDPDADGIEIRSLASSVYLGANITYKSSRNDIDKDSIGINYPQDIDGSLDNDEYKKISDISAVVEPETFGPYIVSGTTGAINGPYVRFISINSNKVKSSTLIDLSTGKEIEHEWDYQMFMTVIKGDKTSFSGISFTVEFDNSVPLTNMSGLFANSAVKTVDFSKFDTSTVVIMSSLFSGCKQISEVDLSNFNTSNVRSFWSMFNSTTFKSLDLSMFDVSKGEDFTTMFNGCSSLESLNISGWNIVNATNLSNTFSNCKLLTEIDVANWNVSNVKLMSNMFSGCESLTKLDLSKWNTKSVTMFTSFLSMCKSLVEIDLSNFNTSNVINIQGMFSNCQSIKYLDLSKWNTKNVYTIQQTFINCKELETLLADDWNINKVTESWQVFTNCNKLTKKPNWYKGE